MYFVVSIPNMQHNPPQTPHNAAVVMTGPQRRSARPETKSLRARGELSYLAPLGSEKISAPYFKHCFFRGEGGITPQTVKHHTSQSPDSQTPHLPVPRQSNTTPPSPQTVKHHASQSQDRNNKYFILYIEFCINNKI